MQNFARTQTHSLNTSEARKCFIDKHMEQEVKQNHLSPDKYSPLKAELKLKEHSMVSPTYKLPNRKYRFPSSKDADQEKKEGPGPGNYAGS